MNKVNIPLGEDGQLDYSYEMIKMNELTTNYARTTTGSYSFASLTSGISYSTDDYPDDASIYNCGELGMIHLLRKVLGGDTGFLVLADDVNKIKEETIIGSMVLDYDWEEKVEGAGYWTCTVPTDGILATDNPVADIDLEWALEHYDYTAEEIEEMLDVWNKVIDIKTLDGAIVITYLDEFTPDRSIPIRLKVMR